MQGVAREPANPNSLCDPRHALVVSCAPFAGDGSRAPAPPDVNLVEIVAGLMLTHDALHPGERLYVREALAAHGVEPITWRSGRRSASCAAGTGLS